MHFNCNDIEKTDEVKIKSKIEGLIYNIQRYSLHDGPGIRTIVFLKGCPLKCPWCANPESQSSHIEKMGEEQVGKIITVGDVMDIVKRDKAFYRRSGGGLTISGGEPLMQPVFTKALIDEARSEGINIAVETSGFQKWEVISELLKDVDYVLFDIKTMDSDLHEELMGVDNEVILQNIKNLSCLNKQITVRIPVIPGYNDSFQNLFETAKFCHDIEIRELHLLPYHQLGVHKYKKLNREYMLNHIKPDNKDKLISDAKKIQDECGVIVKVH
ncbi:MAG: glycyl-radical enzyme activating protein family [Sedimentibacter sp.]|jgi:pyruvate formate lyase activating enzyme|nr:glycyl-radical enzyme activating protein family [Sedimentibacter sp.]